MVGRNNHGKKLPILEISWFEKVTRSITALTTKRGYRVLEEEKVTRIVLKIDSKIPQNRLRE